MPALTGSVLRAKLKASLPPQARFLSGPDETHPAIVQIPGLGQVRFYLWTVTHVQSSDRPLDEYKIQLILPGQSRRARGKLTIDAAGRTFLLGYSPDFGVFVAWEARLHTTFAFSAAVQVKEDLLEEARAFGWAVANPRTVTGGDEIRAAFSPGNLLHYLKTSRKADQKRVFGASREALLLFETPKVALPPRERQRVATYVPRLRQRLNSTRLQRDSRFGAMVRREYSHACALCGVSLNVVEGAHIIPVNQKGSEDKVWNGVALCRNHHRLFDSFAFVIKPDLKVALDVEIIQFFRDCGRVDGLTTLLDPFDGKKIRRPLFFRGNSGARKKMISALSLRQASAAMS